MYYFSKFESTLSKNRIWDWRVRDDVEDSDICGELDLSGIQNSYYRREELIQRRRRNAKHLSQVPDVNLRQKRNSEDRTQYIQDIMQNMEKRLRFKRNQQGEANEGAMLAEVQDLPVKREPLPNTDANANGDSPKSVIPTEEPDKPDNMPSNTPQPPVDIPQGDAQSEQGSPINIITTQAPTPVTDPQVLTNEHKANELSGAPETNNDPVKNTAEGTPTEAPSAPGDGKMTSMSINPVDPAPPAPGKENLINGVDVTKTPLNPVDDANTDMQKTLDSVISQTQGNIEMTTMKTFTDVVKSFDGDVALSNEAKAAIDVADSGRDGLTTTAPLSEMQQHINDTFGDATMINKKDIDSNEKSKDSGLSDSHDAAILNKKIIDSNEKSKDSALADSHEAILNKKNIDSNEKSKDSALADSHEAPSLPSKDSSMVETQIVAVSNDSSSQSVDSIESSKLTPKISDLDDIKERIDLIDDAKVTDPEILPELANGIIEAVKETILDSNPSIESVLDTEVNSTSSSQTADADISSSVTADNINTETNVKDGSLKIDDGSMDNSIMVDDLINSKQDDSSKIITDESIVQTSVKTDDIKKDDTVIKDDSILDESLKIADIITDDAIKIGDKVDELKLDDSKQDDGKVITEHNNKIDITDTSGSVLPVNNNINSREKSSSDDTISSSYDSYDSTELNKDINAPVEKVKDIVDDMVDYIKETSLIENLKEIVQDTAESIMDNDKSSPLAEVKEVVDDITENIKENDKTSQIEKVEDVVEKVQDVVESIQSQAKEIIEDLTENSKIFSKETVRKSDDDYGIISTYPTDDIIDDIKVPKASSGSYSDYDYSNTSDTSDDMSIEKEKDKKIDDNVKNDNDKDTKDIVKHNEDQTESDNVSKEVDLDTAKATKGDRIVVDSDIKTNDIKSYLDTSNSNDTEDSGDVNNENIITDNTDNIKEDVNENRAKNEIDERFNASNSSNELQDDSNEIVSNAIENSGITSSYPITSTYKDDSLSDDVKANNDKVDDSASKDDTDQIKTPEVDDVSSDSKDDAISPNSKDDSVSSDSKDGVGLPDSKDDDVSPDSKDDGVSLNSKDEGISPDSKDDGNSTESKDDETTQTNTHNADVITQNSSEEEIKSSSKSGGDENSISSDIDRFLNVTADHDSNEIDETENTTATKPMFELDSDEIEAENKLTDLIDQTHDAILNEEMNETSSEEEQIRFINFTGNHDSKDNDEHDTYTTNNEMQEEESEHTSETNDIFDTDDTREKFDEMEEKIIDSLSGVDNHGSFEESDEIIDGLDNFESKTRDASEEDELIIEASSFNPDRRMEDYEPDDIGDIGYSPRNPFFGGKPWKNPTHQRRKAEMKLSDCEYRRPSVCFSPRMVVELSGKL